MSDGSWIRISAKEAGLDAATIQKYVRPVLEDAKFRLTQNPEFRQDIGNELVRLATPYVPERTGKLVWSGEATTDGRVYWTATNSRGYNYAYIQYTNTEYHHEYGKHSYWLDYVDYQEFYAEVQRLAIWYLKDEEE